MTRRKLLQCAASALPFAAPLAQTGSPRNVILILADDMGWRDLGCYGSTFFETPNIDRLARAGVRFTDAYAACPVCSPSRAAILTGKYPARLHVTDWIPGRKQWPTARVLTPAFEQQLPLPENTIAESLARSGYTSASIGKWHLGGKGFEPTAQGFALNIGGTERGSPSSYFSPWTVPGLEQSEPGEYLTDRLHVEANNFLRQHARSPFFLYLPHFTPHLPLQAQDELIRKYEAKARAHPSPGNPVYAAMIESLDRGVGSLMRELDALGIADRTAVLFTSDNGGVRFQQKRQDPITSNAPLRSGKGHVYEGGIRVPLIIRQPGGANAGAVSSVPAIGADLYSTVLDLALPGRSHPSPDGVSLVPALAGPRLGRDLFWHYPHYSDQGGEPAGAIRRGRHKLIEFYTDGRRELYDLEADIGETRDLSREQPRLATTLHTALERWRKSVDAAMPAPNPGYDPATAGEGLTGSDTRR